MRIGVLLLAVIFIAGCSIPDISGGVIKVDEKKKEEGFKDVLVIKDIDTLPKSPVLPSETGRNVAVALNFVIENKDDRKSATNIQAEIFDTGSFTVPTPSQTISFILPQEQRLIRFDMTSPSKDKIAGLKTQTNVNFRVLYNFSGSTLFNFAVVDLEEIKRLQREGQTVTVPYGIDPYGSGPIQVHIELLGTKYAVNGYPTMVMVKVFNKGDRTRGTIVGSEIKPHKLKVFFPAVLPTITPPSIAAGPSKESYETAYGNVVSFSSHCGSHNTGDTWGECYNSNHAVPCQSAGLHCQAHDELEMLCEVTGSKVNRIACSNSVTCGGTRNCGGGGGGGGTAAQLFACTGQAGGTECENTEPIPLFKGESPPLLFTTTDADLPAGTPYKTYAMTASVSYQYELRGSKDIDIMPLAAP
ncbi:MAG: hypothetical protein HYY37_02580 [Candidatus Aenigmarchaeota archaeon]|nr:hypothetical protein [Candidatus Aenigmarchaeota archaeon]